jgi:Ca2+-transporting ATPase
MTGADIAALDDAALAAAIERVRVFARVRPDQKLRLVQAYRAAGEVVAMTGDGVNDAPALKAAHIGIAMGTRGSDVAREAAALVLLDDDFTAMVGAVRLGRRIYDNIRNAMRYLIAVHLPLAGMAFIPLAVGWPFFFFPVHVVFLEFVIDPACSIVFEAERSDAHIMERAPRPASQRLFDRGALAIGIALGVATLAAVAIVYGAALALALGEGAARALAFSTLVTANLALILVNRSHHLTLREMAARPNQAVRWIVSGTLLALLAILYVPALAKIFRFAPPGLGALAVAALAGVAAVAWFDLLKVARRSRGEAGRTASFP